MKILPETRVGPGGLDQTLALKVDRKDFKGFFLHFPFSWFKIGWHSFLGPPKWVKSNTWKRERILLGPNAGHKKTNSGGENSVGNFLGQNKFGSVIFCRKKNWVRNCFGPKKNR